MIVSKIPVDRAAAAPRNEAQRFSGTVCIQVLQETSDGLRVQAVFFEPGARTRPHIHIHDQILHCLEGEGVVAAARDSEEKPESVRIQANDTVYIPRNTWHWHGATRANGMAHISIVVQDDGDKWQGVELKDWADYREG